ncbi:hypothetical protein [Sorangium sp. So ce385]|uniref:hypothetical protein n=1 Tax=Sorangium sp. So ce385 TaxID=3133308 RepID=UPI003F5C109C
MLPLTVDAPPVPLPLPVPTEELPPEPVASDPPPSLPQAASAQGSAANKAKEIV